MVRWNICVLALIFFLFGNYDFVDIKEAFIYYAEYIVPSNLIFGIIIVSFILLIALFLDYDTYLIIKKYKNKVKVKEKF